MNGIDVHLVQRYALYENDVCIDSSIFCLIFLWIKSPPYIIWLYKVRRNLNYNNHNTVRTLTLNINKFMVETLADKVQQKNWVIPYMLSSLSDRGSIIYNDQRQQICH